MPEKKTNIIGQLQKEILLLQGFKPISAGTAINVAWGQINDAFPNGTFPLGAVHEFFCNREEDASATSGFISARAAREARARSWGIPIFRDRRTGCRRANSQLRNCAVI